MINVAIIPILRLASMFAKERSSISTFQNLTRMSFVSKFVGGLKLEFLNYQKFQKLDFCLSQEYIQKCCLESFLTPFLSTQSIDNEEKYKKIAAMETTICKVFLQYRLTRYRLFLK